VQISSNTTPFKADLFTSADPQGIKYCTVIVKATFDVGSDGACRPAEEQLPLMYHDRLHGDHVNTATQYESDFVPVKPHADVLLHANVHVPGERPARLVEAALMGEGLSKRVLVHGLRQWRRTLMGNLRIGDAAPFATQPLAWHFAFGGSSSVTSLNAHPEVEARNLVGMGLYASAAEALNQPLPHQEDPQHAIGSWKDRPPPIGFGPVGRGWQPRVALAGTYDANWLHNVRPFLPADFDTRYHQAAPLDQQLPKLNPGMRFGCFNMNPSGRFVVQLPAMTVPVHFKFEDRVESELTRTDTLIIEPGSSRIVLVGRASILLPRKPTALREIHVGRAMRTWPVGKRHYASLGEAVTALKRGR
jgi:hypothetical protein